MADLKFPPAKSATYEGENDQLLWIQLKQGNKTVLELIYNNNIKLLLNYGVKILKNEEQVADIIQDLFIEIWESRERLSNTQSIKFYLLKALKYKIFRTVSKQKKIFIQNEMPKDYDFELTLSFESEIIQRETSETEVFKLQSAIKELTPKQREIIYLRFYHNLNYDEISSIMSISLQGSYNLLSKALKFLNHQLRKQIFLLLILLLRF